MKENQEDYLNVEEYFKELLEDEDEEVPENPYQNQIGFGEFLNSINNPESDFWLPGEDERKYNLYEKHAFEDFLQELGLNNEEEYLNHLLENEHDLFTNMDDNYSSEYDENGSGVDVEE